MTLSSGVAPFIVSLLAVKHAIGWPYTESERHLVAFDALCAARYPGQGTLTRPMAMDWVTARPSEHVNGQIRRITPVRQLAKHMIALGVDAYVIPSGIPGKQVRYRPHLFTPAQLRALFDAADRIGPSPYGGQRHLIIPVMFRMIYCLGLRPGEARRAHRNDVNLTRGTIHIRESKGHKDRVVFLSADLHDYARTYDTKISAHHPDRVAFFPNRYGGPYSSATIDHWFHELLDDTHPPITAVPGCPPRIYDLRHAHVIEVINRWARAGRDPQSLIAHLGLHLGHTNPEDTWYYFHLAADYHPDLRSLANASIESTLPEVSHALR